MPLDRDRLLVVHSGLRSGGSGAAAVYGGYLDRLPRLFGSAKLADEADLILAELTAAEMPTLNSDCRLVGLAARQGWWRSNMNAVS